MPYSTPPKAAATNQLCTFNVQHCKSSRPAYTAAMSLHKNARDMDMTISTPQGSSSSKSSTSSNRNEKTSEASSLSGPTTSKTPEEKMQVQPFQSAILQFQADRQEIREHITRLRRKITHSRGHRVLLALMDDLEQRQAELARVEKLIAQCVGREKRQAAKCKQRQLQAMQADGLSDRQIVLVEEDWKEKRWEARWEAREVVVEERSLPMWQELERDHFPALAE